jgi:hypothetical protein
MSYTDKGPQMKIVNLLIVAIIALLSVAAGRHDSLPERTFMMEQK